MALFNKNATQVENKIPDITSLTKKAALNIESVEVESKICDITNLATKATLNEKDTDWRQNTSCTGFITTPEFNRLTKIKEETESISSKSQEDTALYIADRITKQKKKKLQTFDIRFF